MLAPIVSLVGPCPQPNLPGILTAWRLLGVRCVVASPTVLSELFGADLRLLRPMVDVVVSASVNEWYARSSL